MKKYELLSPAGDFQSLRAGIQAGCNAIYFGLKEFNMRDSAKNFSISDLKEINKICGKKVKKYLTLNTIIYNYEIKKLEEIIKKVKGKVDAIICWDLAVIELCRKYKIPVHISTQASVSNSKSAGFYKKIGAERVILARELNLKQIKEIAKIIPVECFIHGAMCVSVSGRCFTSQFLQSKSANRGQCTHPCRRAYYIRDKDGYELKLENNRVMSAKDLCTLPFIEKLKKAGITAFKIEGRNRPAEYVSIVTKVYRRALDKKFSKEELKDSLEELKKVYNRGFSSGFYLKIPCSEDFSVSENGEAKERKQILGEIEKYWPKIGVAALKIRVGKVKLGDEIYISGKETGIIRARVESMEIEHKKIAEADRGQIVGIKIPFCRKGDSVFIIEKR
ncbi:U32 family peptidase [Candidatus Pacearchaeota archaeon]|nr:U32 family peptidase [Candidatus Pacearchaeota archaeon]